MKAKISSASQALKLSPNLAALGDPWRPPEFQVIAVTIIFNLQLERNYYLSWGRQPSLPSLVFSLRYCNKSTELHPKTTRTLLWKNVMGCLLSSASHEEHTPMLQELHRLSIHDSRSWISHKKLESPVVQILSHVFMQKGRWVGPGQQTVSPQVCSQKTSVSGDWIWHFAAWRKGRLLKPVKKLLWNTRCSELPKIWCLFFFLCLK